MLLNCFFRTSASVRARGYVFFESTTPGDYEYTFKRKRKLKVDLVGGGAGGFVGKIGLRWNTGRPDEILVSGLQALGGGSGGYTSYIYNNQQKSIKLTVGAGGTGYATSNMVHIFDETTSTYKFPNVSGSNSTMYRWAKHPFTQDWYWAREAYAIGEYEINFTGNTVTDDFYFWFNKDYVSGMVEGEYPDQFAQEQTNPVSQGGASVYNGYGSGGAAGINGDHQTGTPWVNNGSNGYVKVTFAD